MEFEGEVTIDADKQRIWELISDPEILVECVPGAKEVNRVSENKYTGVIERGLAGVNISLDGEVEMTELNAPDNIVAEASGQDTRTNSRMDATAEMTITEEDEGSTLSYHIDMDFTGRLATLGSRIVKRKINSDINTYFDNLQEMAEGNGDDEEEVEEESSGFFG